MEGKGEDDRTVNLTALGAMVVARKDIGTIWSMMDRTLDFGTGPIIDDVYQWRIAIDNTVASLAELKSHL
jgi:hypothetical protein